MRPFCAFLPVKNELGESAKKLKLQTACLVTMLCSLATFEIGAITADLGTTAGSGRGADAALSELLLGRIGACTSGNGSALSEVAVLTTSSSVGHVASSPSG